jgi:uncharacterized protein (TIGR00369 family)
VSGSDGASATAPPGGLLALIRRARADRDLSALVAALPYARTFGISVADQGGELVTKMAFTESLIGNSTIRALHGGAVGALLESAAIFSLLMGTESLQIPKQISLTVEYLRTTRTLDLYAAAEFTKLGRRIASVRAFAWQEDRTRPVAAASGTFLLKAPPAG